LLSLGVVALVGAIQFLRGVKGLSIVFYETILVIAALVATASLFERVSDAVGLAPVAAFAGMFVVLGVLGMVLAFLVNRFVAFDAGAFNYLFALVLAVAFGWAVGHAVLRSLYIALVPHDKEFLEAVHRSWMASQLLRFGAFYELLALLRFARYSNVAE